MNNIQVLLVEIKKRKCYVYCIKVTQIISFGSFFESCAATFFEKRTVETFFFHKKQQSSKFCPIEESSVLLHHCMELKKIIAKECFFG